MTRDRVMRALIVADDASSAAAIRRSMRSGSFRDVVDRYVDARRPCGTVVAEIAPDIVIVDETRSPDNALARIAEVRGALPDAKIVLLSSRMDAALLSNATVAGADSAINKTPSTLSLGALLREVVAGNVFNAFAPAVVAAKPITDLTMRELEILRLVAAGASNSEIGRQLWIAEQTVKFHLSNVFRKLGVSNRTEASHHAYVNGLLEARPGAGIAA
jgi:DNA-binding NarL/FixJ family response regulator